MKITLKTMPLTVNSLYAHTGRMRFMTRKGKDNKEAIAWEARQQYRGKPLEGPVGLTVEFFYPKANRDIDGGLKSLLDAFKGILLVDDKQIVELHVFKKKDSKNPRVIVEIKPT